MFKTGLNIARFREHVGMIEEETANYFKRWGTSGEKSEFHGLLACFFVFDSCEQHIELYVFYFN